MDLRSPWQVRLLECGRVKRLMGHLGRMARVGWLLGARRHLGVRWRRHLL